MVKNLLQWFCEAHFMFDVFHQISEFVLQNETFIECFSMKILIEKYFDL